MPRLPALALLLVLAVPAAAAERPAGGLRLAEPAGLARLLRLAEAARPPLVIVLLVATILTRPRARRVALGGWRWRCWCPCCGSDTAEHKS